MLYVILYFVLGALAFLIFAVIAAPLVPKILFGFFIPPMIILLINTVREIIAEK